MSRQVSHLVTAERCLMNGHPAAVQLAWVLLASAALVALFAPPTAYLPGWQRVSATGTGQAGHAITGQDTPGCLASVRRSSTISCLCGSCGSARSATARLSLLPLRSRGPASQLAERLVHCGAARLEGGLEQMAVARHAADARGVRRRPDREDRRVPFAQQQVIGGQPAGA